MPKFTMILPTHNGAQHIRKALDSIAAQTYKNYELICVCDACDDDTEEICRSYGARVEPVSFACAGLARNRGLELATGEWLLFMDDDDWLLHEYVFQLIADNAGRRGEDILAMSFIWRGVGYAVQTPEQLFVAVWNKAWRRAFVGDTRFSDKRYGDDADFHNAMLAKNPKMAFWDTPIYYYDYLRPGSLSHRMKTDGHV